jgi:hypothetical protein
MQKKITVEGEQYLCSDEEQIHTDDELVFEIKNYRDTETTYVIGLFDDLLGSPIKKVWKVLEHIHEDYEIGGSE